MSKMNVVPQIYGYAVCVVCVFVILFTLPDFVMQTGNLINPMHSESGPRVLSESFEQWKYQFIRAWWKDDFTDRKPANFNMPEPPDEATLRRMYDSEKSEAMQSYLHGVRVAFVQRGLLIILSGVFFGTHWKWVRKFVAAKQDNTT